MAGGGRDQRGCSRVVAQDAEQLAFTSVARGDEGEFWSALERGLELAIADELVLDTGQRFAAAIPFEVELEHLASALQCSVPVGTDEFAPGLSAAALAPPGDDFDASLCSRRRDQRGEEAVCLDEVVELLARRELERLRSAPVEFGGFFVRHERSSLVGTGDWRAYAEPLAPPVLRLPALREAAQLEPMGSQRHRHGARELPTSVEVAVTDTGDERLGILLLGPLELTGCKKKQPRRKATAELIAYLAVQRRPATRDELLEALWPGDDPRRSAGRFYQAASEARMLLGDAFIRDRDTYTLDRQRLRIDLDDLDRLRSEMEATTGEQRQASLERVLALFRGPPLARMGALWADTEARRLCAIEAEVLELLGRLRLEAGDASRALDIAQRAEALDSSNERTVQLAMQAEAALGHRESVVDRYERLCRELDERFGLEPNHETKLLYRRLLSQDAKEDGYAQESLRAAP